MGPRSIALSRRNPSVSSYRENVIYKEGNCYHIKYFNSGESSDHVHSSVLTVGAWQRMSEVRFPTIHFKYVFWPHWYVKSKQIISCWWDVLIKIEKQTNCCKIRYFRRQGCREIALPLFSLAGHDQHKNYAYSISLMLR